MQNAECKMQNAELTNSSQRWKSEAIEEMQNAKCRINKFFPEGEIGGD